MTLPTISASKIKVFRTCNRQYYYRYILPKQQRPIEDKNIGALLGLSLHKAIERKYRAGENALAVFQDVMLTTLDEWEDKGFTVKGVEWFSKSLKDGKAILREFDWGIFDPVDLEQEFTLYFPNASAPIALINGYIDMTTTNGLVVDHKSQRRLPNQDQLNHDPQFLIYAWAYREIYGNLPTAAVWNHLRTNQLVYADVLTDFDFKLNQLTLDIDAMLNAKHFVRRQMDSVCTNECSFYALCYGLTAKQQQQVDDEVDGE